MATHAVTAAAPGIYSGLTTTTDTDILTITGRSGQRPNGGVVKVRVQNTHASAILYVGVNGTNPTSTPVQGQVTVAAGKEVVLPLLTSSALSTCEVRLTGSAACTYNVIPEYS